jgi:hypothetical protein
VVGLERGPDSIPGNDFVLPTIRNELRYGRRSSTSIRPTRTRSAAR